MILRGEVPIQVCSSNADGSADVTDRRPLVALFEEEFRGSDENLPGPLVARNFSRREEFLFGSSARRWPPVVSALQTVLGPHNSPRPNRVYQYHRAMSSPGWLGVAGDNIADGQWTRFSRGTIGGDGDVCGQ